MTPPPPSKKKRKKFASFNFLHVISYYSLPNILWAIIRYYYYCWEFNTGQNNKKFTKQNITYILIYFKCQFELN